MGQYLSSPCTLVEIEQSAGKKMEFGVGSLQGWRVSMEDAHVAVIGLKDNGKGSGELDKNENGLFGVFDGHGGKEVALFTEAKFEDALINSQEFIEGHYGEAMRKTFHKIDELLSDPKNDDYLKQLKKVIHPVTYTKENHPTFPTEKTTRNIRFHEVLLSKHGATPQNTASSTSTPPVVSRSAIACTPTIVTQDKPYTKVNLNSDNLLAPSSSSSLDSPTRGRAPTLMENEGDATDYDLLVTTMSSLDTAAATTTTISSEDILDKIKSGEFNKTEHVETNGSSGGDSGENSSEGENRTNINNKNNRKSNSPTKSGSASSIAKLIIGHGKKSNITTNATAAPIETVLPETINETDTNRGDHVTENGKKKQDDEEEEYEVVPIVEEEGEDPNAIPTYSYTIPPRAPVVVEEEEGEDPNAIPTYSYTIPSRAPAVMAGDDDDKNKSSSTSSPIASGSSGDSNDDNCCGTGINILSPTPIAAAATFTPPARPPTVCRLQNHRINAGCTAVVALKIKNQLFVANAGDSRAVLCRADGTAYDLSIDHKPNDDIERNRVEKAGGFVNAMGRINGNLNLSRSLGDLKYKQNPLLSPDAQIITAEPDIVTYILQDNDQFMIIGCDGIWDCLTSQEAVDLVKQKLAQGLTPAKIIPQILQQILAQDTILSKGLGTDNMTLLIVKFKNDE